MCNIFISWLETYGILITFMTVGHCKVQTKRILPGLGPSFWECLKFNGYFGSL